MDKGVFAYNKGMYFDAVKWYDAALEETEPTTLIGGSIQINKAQALYACRKRDEAIELYKLLENTHPEGKIKREADRLRYIIEAPEMKLGDDEYVEVPLMRDAYQYKSKWSSSGAKRRTKKVE